VAHDQPRRVLLERLAALPWFTQNGEVAATHAVAMLLEEPSLRDTLVRHLARISDTDLRSVASFHAEVVHDDRARPDLQGHDSGGHPLVIIEAKFGARLTTAHLQAYVTYQLAMLDPGTRGALVVLVPSYRMPEAEAALISVRSRGREAESPSASVATAVLTWDELLAVWDDAAQLRATRDEDAIVCDLRQLRGLCQAMAALDIAPLGLIATGALGWQEREGDLRALVDQATAGFPTPDGRRLPLGLERGPEFGYYRRYIPGGPPDRDCYCSVGVVSGLTDQGTPFWLRYARQTAGFQAIASRVMRSRLAADARGTANTYGCHCGCRRAAAGLPSSMSSSRRSTLSGR
jgi:hypothetical protein